MEININPEDYFSKKNLKILRAKARKEGKPLEQVILELCDFLMEHKLLTEVLNQYAKGNEKPDIRHLTHDQKVRFVQMRKEDRVKS